jgi:hypothetical protein
MEITNSYQILHDTLSTAVWQGLRAIIWYSIGLVTNLYISLSHFSNLHSPTVIQVNIKMFVSLKQQLIKQSCHLCLTKSNTVMEAWAASRLGRFTARKEAPVPIGEVGWTAEQVWTEWRRENSWPYWTLVQPAASRYTDCATPAILTTADIK